VQLESVPHPPFHGAQYRNAEDHRDYGALQQQTLDQAHSGALTRNAGDGPAARQT
jgi:hypothetical protein